MRGKFGFVGFAKCVEMFDALSGGTSQVRVVFLKVGFLSSIPGLDKVDAVNLTSTPARPIWRALAYRHGSELGTGATPCLYMPGGSALSYIDQDLILSIIVLEGSSEGFDEVFWSYAWDSARSERLKAKGL